MEEKVLNLALAIIPTGYFQGGSFKRFQARLCFILFTPRWDNLALSLQRHFWSY